MTRDAEVYSLFRKQTFRLILQGSQCDIPGPATESSLVYQMSKRLESCCISLTRDVAAHVLDVHLMESDFSGGVSDSDCAILVVHDLRCSFLSRRHMHFSWRTQGHRAVWSLATFPHKADVTHKCLHYKVSQTPEHSCCFKQPSTMVGKLRLTFYGLPLVSMKMQKTTNS